jgi:amino acid transporter
MIVPFVNGSFHASNLQPLGVPGHLSAWTTFSLFMTWLYLACWTTYGFECVATFAPEFADTIKDTPRALRSSAIFSVLIYGLVPLGLVGVLGTTKLTSNAYTTFIPALNTILGTGAGTLIIIFVVASLVLSANVATMDGSRALWQMSRDRLTVTWLGRLNKRGVPDAGMTLDLVVQVALIWTLGSPLAILAASNLGYVLSHVGALVAFILLRRDQPNAVRPIRRGPIWLWIAGILAGLNTLFIIVGSLQYNLSISNFTAPFSDNLKIFLIGVGLLLIALLMYLYRVYVQDRGQPVAEPVKS